MKCKTENVTMPNLVVSGAKLKCSQAMPPSTSTLTVIPMGNSWQIEGKPVATVKDNIPMMNISSFGMCKSKTNPAVIAATAAASGVETPAPCVPVILSPWTSGSQEASINDSVALNDKSKCTCAYNGNIKITDSGQTIVSIP